MSDPPNPPRQAMRPSRAARVLKRERSQHGHEKTETAKPVLRPAAPRVDGKKSNQ